MSYPLVLDIETQYTFQEMGKNLKKLKVSLVGVYNYQSDKYLTFVENELKDLFPIIEHASVVIGFNIKGFDFPVLAPYYLGDIHQIPTLDILEEVKKSLGFRVALDSLADTTLGIKKSGHGLLAIDYFREGQIDKLKKYCLDDVRITKKLYEYGKKHGKLYFLSKRGRQEVPVSFNLEKKSINNVALSMPF